MTEYTPEQLRERITNYLAGGGLFNPELANHDAVRDLLIDTRDCIESLAAKVALLEDDITMWRAEATRRGNEALATASDEITKRERAEAALAEAERKGREAGLREAARIAYRAESEGANSPITARRIQDAILSAIGEGK